eukprot:6208741-Pleurochrysis_carterae.AAC.1
MLPCGIPRDIIVSLIFFQPVGCEGGGRPSEICFCIVNSDCKAVLPRGRISRLSLFSFILVARQKFFKCFSNRGSSVRFFRKAMESSAKCPNFR